MTGLMPDEAEVAGLLAPSPADGVALAGRYPSRRRDGLHP